ncbi:MAG: response regulator [Elusimicrobia bacterium]|nr:response regulator [Elusimicrobiota bacterium]
MAIFGFGKKGPYVLHIEDDWDTRNLLQDMLKAFGYEYIGAASVEEGLKAARSRIPALILLDTMMPFMDGYAGCKLLRADAQLKDIPIIMLTALQRMADVEKAFSAGANDYLVKPVNPARLKEKVGKFLPPKS